MDRRRLLQLLGLAVPALVLDPERLLWTPGAKTFFLPPAAGWVDWDLIYMREAIRVIHRQMNERRDGDQYDSAFVRKYLETRLS